MGSIIRYHKLFETRRLVYLLGMVFGLALMIQYFGFPYGYALSSLFTANGGQISSSQRVDQSGNFSRSDNLKHGSVVNATNTNLINETTNETKLADANNEEVEGGSMPPMNERSGDTLTEDVDPEDESPFKDSKLDNKSNVESLGRNSSLPPDKAANSEDDLQASNSTSESSLSRVVDTDGGDSIFPAPTEAKSLEISPTALSIAPPPLVVTPQVNLDAKKEAPLISSYQNISEKEGNTGHLLESDNLPVQKRTDHAPTVSHKIPEMKESDKPIDSVVSIAEMNVMQQETRTSFRSMKPRWSSDVDQELLHAKSVIENSPLAGNEPGLYAPLYRNLSMFMRSYELMEQILKVYIYSEGARPVFHTPVLKGIYASEGWFMKLLKRNKKFVTKNPKKAHLFYLPFSSRMLEETLYVPDSHSRRNLVRYLSDYLDIIIQRHNFWNRTAGADHFLVACHDWAPAETKRIMANCIRALCNADIKEGFQFGKDVSLPETYIRAEKNPLREIGGKRLSKRRTLAFFAGNMHGYLRPILLNNWENKDPDMKIFGKISKVSYVQYMKSSKYCICAKGYEVNSPRVVEAIFYECVPVIISDNFIPPFFETLNWEAFAIFVPEKDIPKLKDILVSIPDRRYREMQRRVKLVQQHFLWHVKPVNKGQVAFLGSFQSGELSGNSNISGNLTFASGLNTTASNVVHEGTAKTELSKTNDATVAYGSEFVMPTSKVTSENNFVLDKPDKDDIAHGVARNETIDDNPIITTAAPLAMVISPLSSSIQNQSTDHSCLRNIPAVIERSYELMEKTLKVYIYASGERPIFHSGPLDGIYASEGWFIKLLQEYKGFVTKNPKKAHLFYLPISFRLLKLTLYVPDSHNRTNIMQFLSNYVDMIAQKYRFWNRTDGADHFIVACHDWAPAVTDEIMSNCKRSLCNADLRGGFQFGKDVSLPQPNIRSSTNPLADLGGKPASKRHTLAFFAGHMHGYLRPILLKHWENRDPDMRIYGGITKASYLRYMKSSKYCICARGSQVNSPRVVEAIYYGCVPVILSDNYVPPLFETLNWESIAVFVQEKDIPNLKNILLSIPDKKYKQMHGRVKQVQQHFLWHIKPSKYDMFHMILHSVWHN
ncbi:hypothetical protein KY290_035284 [Solanum tuberosum]|uniref:Exostosin GT47 domain-containing protein n=1 Tax=Solanum tuberosum TaxID=4113 RepID=A0ABQ7U5P1_SOLTU|nr:hypothetical protein KY289_034804 [Solanum tuberosum]KAH0742241.1 hypothetical protein KY290_035284 [Solanum tuberosum]